MCWIESIPSTSRPAQRLRMCPYLAIGFSQLESFKARPYEVCMCVCGGVYSNLTGVLVRRGDRDSQGEAM